MPTTGPPNVLFLFADQMHAFAMGCMGNGDIATPNLDRLAAEGTLFENCYTCNPVCTPYRASLFNGRYSCQTGMIGLTDLPMPAGEHCLADLVNAHGYRSSYVGKWHIGDGGNRAVPEGYRCGFTDFIGFQCVNDFFRDVWFFDEDGKRHDYDAHRTVATTDIAMERLERITDVPFCMFVSYSNPHYPVQPDKQYADMYWDKELALRPNFREIERPFETPGRLRPRCEDPEHTRRGEDTVSYIKMYYAMVTQMDAEIGRLLGKLDELGLTDNTMIVFTSDHGDMQGSHGLGNKHVHYEESTRVPLIVKVPGTSGHRVGVPVGTTDFLPSMLDHIGAPPSAMQEGRSFMDLATGGTAPHKDAVFVENGRDYFMVRKGPYKMVVDQNDYGARHLYHLGDDPYEMTDLVGQASVAGVQAELVQRIADWHQDVMSRANPNRWQAQDVKHWRLWRCTPPTPEEYGSPEFIAEWCRRYRT